MNKFFTVLSLSALLAAPAFAKAKTAKIEKAPIAGDAAAKPAEGGTAPEGDKKEEKPVKKGSKKTVKKTETTKTETKTETKAEAKPAEAAPAK